jgi:hypothetical protein
MKMEIKRRRYIEDNKNANGWIFYDQIRTLIKK